MRIILRDLTHSLRLLRRTPAFTFIAVLTLALGIGTNTIVFSVVSASLLRTLPYPEPRRLMVVHLFIERAQSSDDISAQSFFMLKERSRSFENMAASYPVDVGINLAGVGKPEYVRGLRVSQGFFPTLGVVPDQGRNFSPEEDRPGGQNCVILSYDLWLHNFGRDSANIGRAVRINDEAYTVIGVMPRSFHSFPETDLWLPLKLDPANATSGNNYEVIVRLGQDSSPANAQHELDTLSAAYPTAMPTQHSPKLRLVLQPLQDFKNGGVRSSLMMLFGAVSSVLLIACLNLAVLLLVRGSARSQEIGIRMALGSSRLRMVQVLLMESGILAFAGGILGIILAKEMLPLIISLVPSDLPLNAAIGIDRRAILFSAGITMLTPILFGLVPSIKAVNFGVNEVTAPFRRGTPTLGQARLGNVLITVQTALAVVLLSSAFLQLQALVRLQSQPMGFDPQGLLVAQVSLTSPHYETAVATTRLMDQVFEQLHGNPEVESVASVSGLPLDRALNLPSVPDGIRDKTVYTSEYWIISNDYFHAMSIKLVAGRTFSAMDQKGTMPVAIINENLARRWWPNTSAVGHFVTAGQQLGPEFSDVQRQIVGVVADTYTAGANRPPPPAIFTPAAQTPDSIIAFTNKEFLTSILVRTSVRTSLEENIRRAMDSTDPNLPLASLRPLTQFAQASLSRPRFYASLATTFGVLALLLTAIGLYGLLGYRIRLRAGEIAVRMAMGARRVQVIGMVVKQGTKLVGIGLVLGLVGAYYARKFLEAMSYNHSGLGIILFAVVLLGAVAMLASFLTALQAASIEPIVVLKNQ
jgi:putative ABC transport system permease protein